MEEEDEEEEDEEKEKMRWVQKMKILCTLRQMHVR